MARLVDDLLDVSRITLGRINLRRERASAAADRRPRRRGEPTAHRRRPGHEFKVQLPPAALHVDVDVVRLTQALLNLLNNAAKYTPAGGRITLTVAEQEGQAVDCGHRYRRGAFRPPCCHGSSRCLPRWIRSGTHAGRLGIGLTLAGRLVGMHGGTLVAHSEASDTAAASRSACR